MIDVSITPNRGDAASVWGVARDLAASGLGRLKTEKVVPVAGKFPSPKKITLDFIHGNEDACPIFAGRLIRGVRNGPAPQWVRDRFKAVGMKSISALVDVTNLISQDRGRPLHVFDADKLSGSLHARMANNHEQVLALDGKTYVLDGQTIVIADDAAARGIAGVMGGMDTGCSFGTANVFIESAWFDPGRVARAGRRQGIISDARYRFERGVDPQFVLPGLELATRLILEWCGGEASDVVIAGALPPPHAHIEFETGLVETLGGIRRAARTHHRDSDRPGLHGAGTCDPACHAAKLAARYRRACRSGGRSGAHSRVGGCAVGGAEPRRRRGQAGADVRAQRRARSVRAHFGGGAASTNV